MKYPGLVGRVGQVGAGFLALAIAPWYALEASTEAAVTFNKDVAPIIFTRCASCHRPGSTAPFSLLTYAAVRPRAAEIAKAVKTRAMPPWKADHAPGEFIGLADLSDAEIATIERWNEEGAIEGEASDLPPVPESVSGWQLGTPDLVATSDAYTLPPGGTDAFRILVIPLPVDRTRFVRGMEFHPGNARAIHHATIRIDQTATSRRLDEESPGAGYSGLISRTAGYPDGHFLSWTPGQQPSLLPPGLAWRLRRNTDLVVELHMQPGTEAEVVQPTVGFYFTDTAPARVPTMIRLGRQNIDIGPEGRYTMTDSFVLPVDVEVQAVQPHAHYRARDISGVATLPDGSTKSLIRIRDWDFRWQHVFRLTTPIALPKGTTISMRYEYDNSAANRRNPSPSSPVRWGQRSGDEMGDLWIQVLTRADADRMTLMAAFRPKMLAEDVVGYQERLRSEPNTRSLHDDVALLYLDLNRPEDAASQFRLSMMLAPDSASAHYNFGVALAQTGRVDSAVEEYTAALKLNPEYALAHNNLGGALLQRGRIDDAAGHFKEAVRIDPDNAGAHHNLSIVYRLRGEWVGAVAELNRANQLQPDNPRTMADLATLLAAAPIESLRDPRRAVALGERAMVLTRRSDAAALDAAAVAYAAVGAFDRALEAAVAGLALKPAQALDEQIRHRMTFYRERRAYVLSEPAKSPDLLEQFRL